MNKFYVGVDLGQVKDYTAIAVVEREEPVQYGFDYVRWLRTQSKLEARFVVRHLERVSLGTPYPAVVGRILQMVRTPELTGRCTVVVDGTGVGRAVVDLIREADMRCELVPVMITAGAGARREGGVWNVPKRDLIGVVQVLLQTGRLDVAANLARARTLVEELMAMKVRVGDGGRSEFGAWREGAHDDMALALALACWRAKGDERVVGEMGCGRLL